MDYQACGDARLAALVRAGQGEAFAELSARYLGLIRAKAKLFEGASAPEKEDLWQEGLLGLYAAAISYQPGRGASFPTYAGVCVYNQMASAVRRHGSSGNRPLNESVPLEDAGEAAVEAGPEALLELREEFGALCRQMDVSLSPWSGGCWRCTSAATAGWRAPSGPGCLCAPTTTPCTGCAPS